MNGIPQPSILGWTHFQRKPKITFYMQKHLVLIRLDAEMWQGKNETNKKGNSWE